jgi:hypothetical protein
VSSRYRLTYQFFYVKNSSTNQNANLLLLDDPSRVRSQITSGLCPKTLVLCAGFVYRVYLKKVPYASSPVGAINPNPDDQGRGRAAGAD